MSESKHDSDAALSSIAAHASALMCEHDIAQDVADDIAKKIVLRLSHAFGGELLYFGKSVARQAMYEEIYDKHNGYNEQQLGKEYNLSVTRIYQILAAERARRAPKNGDLFPETLQETGEKS